MATAADLGKDDLKGLMVFMADVRDEISEAAQTLARVADPTATADRLTRIEERLAALARPQAPCAQPAHAGRWARWLVVPLLAALGGAGVGWTVGGRDQREIRTQARLMGQVDALLVAQGSTLPPALRSALQEVYTKAGFQAPGQRAAAEATRRPTGGRP